MPIVLTRQLNFPAPPKTVFQFLYDVSLIEDISAWKVTMDGDEIGVGFRWHERKLLTKRTWTVTDFDRRGLSFTATSGDLAISMSAKKGGPGSCNAQMRVSGSDAAVAKFAKSDGNRLEKLRALLLAD